MLNIAIGHLIKKLGVKKQMSQVGGYVNYRAKKTHNSTPSFVLVKKCKHSKVHTTRPAVGPRN